MNVGEEDKELNQLTFYDLLRLPLDASPDQIREAYREIAKVYHPDSNFYNEIVEEDIEDSSGSEFFKRITEAYTTLVNPQKRAAYDSTLTPRLKSWDKTDIQNRYSASVDAPSKGGFGRGKPIRDPLQKGFGATSAQLKRYLSGKIESIGDMLNRSGSVILGFPAHIFVLILFASLTAGALIAVAVRFLTR